MCRAKSFSYSASSRGSIRTNISKTAIIYMNASKGSDQPFSRHSRCNHIINHYPSLPELWQWWCAISLPHSPGCKNFSENNIITGGECMWGQEYVINPDKFSHQSCWRRKINQNEEKDLLRQGFCRRRRLESLATKPSTKLTSRRLCPSPIRSSSQKDPFSCPWTDFRAGTMPQSTTSMAANG